MVWATTQAKAKFSTVVNKAMTEGPQEITKSGKPAVVVVAVDEWRKSRAAKPPQENLVDFLLRTAPKDTGVTFKRVKGKAQAAKF